MIGLSKKLTIREALHEPKLLGHALPGDSWLPWRTMLVAIMGEELTDDERAIYRQFTGRDAEPGFIPAEFFAVAGRRSGKTRAAGTLAAFVGTCVDHSAYLSSSERATIPVMAVSTVQAQKAFSACMLLEDSPILSKQIDTSNSETIRLKTRCDIEVRPGNQKTIRGITSPLAIADEIAHFYTEGVLTDAGLLDAVRPSLQSGKHHGPLVAISSPWGPKGELYDAFAKHHGPNGDADIVVAKGSSLEWNSTLDPKTVQRAMERDAAMADAEWNGNFLASVLNIFTIDGLNAITDIGVTEREPIPGIRYAAYADPSGGTGLDGFTLTIAHMEDGVVVLDLIRETLAPFNPEQIVEAYAADLKRYGVRTIQTDRYASAWNSTSWVRHGIAHRPSTKTASELFAALLPVVNAQNIRLLDDEKLRRQALGLERRISSGGKQQIGHGRSIHAHDDIVNAVAGVSYALTKPAAHPKFALAAPAFSLNGGEFSMTYADHSAHDPASFGASRSR
ncbi:hypothetical protein NA8A_05608 [Nitratireductor indicus C115]|uniref:Terminase n=1 Tax=Nitratireductor indicus C115 TaxID=1231190 RepID=K2N7N1_9HYPH|nr:hypothetical protein [Nitratireductor indicus]EKF43483.1 hypothetical protein NA8A_05608 [Nitratireductor indicus C115]SFQ06652.1 hypothetical protein SAMN05216176_101184 [Nitratireductor indicus]